MSHIITTKDHNRDVLTTRCAPVTTFEGIASLAEDLLATARYRGGCGLAAPQIGDTRRVVVAKLHGTWQAMVNPVITYRHGIMPMIEECLSAPYALRPTLRSWRVDVLYQTTTQEYRCESYCGIAAVILQHEIDHFDEKLIVG